MQIQKLNWAGIKIICGNKTILIDAVENFAPYFPVLGHPLSPTVCFTDTVKADYILFTHLHLDHFDVSVINKCLKPTGSIIAYKKLQQQIDPLLRKTIYLDVDESFTQHGIIFKSVFSLDGIGEEQTAWIIEYDGKKILHAGDTIWHNQFWKAGKTNPGIDYAFLPVNGAVVNFRIIGLAYSTIPASMTPEQAFNAAKLLQAKTLIPIHYGLFETALYKPVQINAGEMDQLAKKIEQPYRLLPDGMYLL